MPNSLLLHRDLEQPFSAPQWPAGIEPVPFTAAAARDCHAVLLRAYAEGGGSIPSSFDDWWRATSSDPEFDPGLVFAAGSEDGRLAGVAICWTSSFVKDIVVDPDFRHRGLGKALLLAAFATLRARGHSRIGLKLRSDNTGPARTLYDRLGFVLG